MSGGIPEQDHHPFLENATAARLVVPCARRLWAGGRPVAPSLTLLRDAGGSGQGRCRPPRSAIRAGFATSSHRGCHRTLTARSASRPEADVQGARSGAAGAHEKPQREQHARDSSRGTHRRSARPRPPAGSPPTSRQSSCRGDRRAGVPRCASQLEFLCLERMVLSGGRVRGRR